MNMTRREFLVGSAATAAYFAALRAEAWCTWELGHTKNRLPKGVDPKPILSFQLPLDDRRRRQNLFIPKSPADGNRFAFGSDGTFTFFHLSDLHEERAKLGERERVFFAKMCEKFQPSLAIVTGDNTNHRCKGMFEESAGAVAQLFADAKVPFAVTFGNHDTEVIGEGWYTAAEQWDFYRRAGGRFFVDRHDPTVMGGGASRIRVLDKENRPKFDLCVLDSGDYGPQDSVDAEPVVTPPSSRWPNGCDSVRRPQVKWAREALAEGVPSLFFQHIIVPESRERMGHGLFQEAAEGEKPSVKLDYLGPKPVRTNPKRAKGYVVEGLGSVPVPKSRHAVYLDEGQSIYEVWKGAPNFRGAYFGHDHMNTFDGVTEDGVRLGMTKTLSKCAYNDDDLALRVFKVRADGTYFTDIFTEKHPDGCGFVL